MAINRASFKTWVAGQTFTARAYVYERGLILDELERLGLNLSGVAVHTGTATPTGSAGALWFDEN